ncbi:cation diffusion facilitator family transporter [Tenacibaculum ascidiaceicola]|uniref:cation diffusion facilitator family transporter n=1 Tax=Tenacibaculum ascidiaceicola TaxID=1699411 RepID=UPI0039ED33C9
MAHSKEHSSCNGHEHDHAAHNHSDKNGLSFAFWLNLFFSIVELIGGIFTNSTAIIADAFHDFMDAGAIGLAILMEKISGKKRTATFSYGYKRFSLLSALILSTFLLSGSIGMIMAAYNSFVNPKEVHSLGMLWLAVLGLAVNGAAFLRIKNGGHGHHHHGHSHGHNHNSESIMLHLLEDVLGWAAVLIGSVIIYFTGWNWIDGILAIGIALFIGYNAVKNLLNTLKVLLQSVPENVNIAQLKSELQNLKGVSNIHDVHVWTLDGSYNVGSLHAVINNNSATAKQEVMNNIVKLMQGFNIQHPTVQIETNENTCAFVSC